MSRLCLICRFAALATLAAFGGAVTTLGRDLAQVLPRDTAVYVGWSQWLEKDSPELKLQRKFTNAAADLTASKDDAEDQGLALAKLLLDALPALQTGSVGIGVFDVDLAGEQPDIQAALVVDADTDVAHLHDVVRKLMAKLAEPAEIEPHVVKGVSLERVQLGGMRLSLLWGVHERVWFLALGDNAAAKVIDCINGQAPTLADAPELKFDREKVHAQVSGRHFCFYADVQRIVSRGREVAQQVMGPLPPKAEQALDELGLTAVRSKYLHLDVREGQPSARGFAHVEGALRGLLKLWDQPPLSDEDLRIIPKDAYWAEVSNLRLAGLWEEFRRVFDVLAPDQVAMLDGSLAMGVQMVGFSIPDDLLPAFGDTWALFDAPDHGGILLAGTVLVGEVRDAEALQGMLIRLVRFFTPLTMQKDIALQVKETRHGEHTIHYVLISGVPSPVAPAWGFAGGRWVFGLYPQAVAAAMKQVDPKTRGESLLDHPDFKAARAHLPAEAQSVGYLDSRYFVRLLYPLVNAAQTMGVSMLGKYGGEIDLAVMPPVAESVAKTNTYVGTTSRDGDGILYASVGAGTAPVLVAVGTAALTGSVMLPSLARAREISKRAESAGQLRDIGQACHVYAKDHQDKFPATLEQLVEAGAIQRKLLRSPREADEDAVSYVYIAGQDENADPRNALAYERVHDQEGTLVLFVDGHAEWLKLDPARAAIRETYRRLNRESELPDEFRE